MKGYDIDLTQGDNVRRRKPRDVEKIENSQVPFEFGTKFKLNNVNGTPQIAICNNFYSRLYDKRRTTATTPLIQQHK